MTVLTKMKKKQKAWAIVTRMDLPGLPKGSILSLELREPVSSLPVVFEVVEIEFIIKK